MSDRICSGGVIVGVDGSSSAAAAACWAATEARMRRAPLCLVHVTAACAPDDPDADHVLEAVAGTVSPETTGSEVGRVRLDGDPASTLCELSQTASMVVVGRHADTTRLQHLLGSVTTSVLHHAHCPVAVVHADPMLSGSTRRRPVLVGVDGSRCSVAAAEIAFDEASWRGVDVVALYVCDAAGGPSANRAEMAALQAEAEYQLDGALTPLCERHPGVTVHRLIRFESPARQLLIQGERAQLVVVGSHGRGALTGILLGSVSAAVARDVRAPVIVARRGAGVGTFGLSG